MVEKVKIVGYVRLGVDYYPISRLPKDPTGLVGFQILQETAAKQLKRLLGKAFRTSKISIKGQDNKQL